MKGMPNPTIEWQECLKEIVFSWDDPDTGKHYHFAVERLEKYLKEVDFEVITVAVDPEFAECMPEQRGLEVHRLKRLLEAPEKWTPIIICVLPDGSALIVDGNHRYYLSAKYGCKVVPAYYVPMEVWGQYLVKFFDYVGNSTDGWSGIL